MDLEFARIKRSSLNNTRMTIVIPARTSNGGLTAPAVRSHTIFGPDIMRGAVMKVRLPRCHGVVDFLNNIYTGTVGNRTVHGCGNLACHSNRETY
jgi:hypothetical protein